MVFLLEAMVLLAAGAEWSGSWTQRFYGSGTADIWEVYGTHGNITELAWKQGWRPLEPLREAEFGKASFHEYVNETLNVRSPRLVVVESPAKVWRDAWQSQHGTTNSTRQKTKRKRAQQ